MAEVVIGKDTSGNRHPLLTDGNGVLQVSIASGSITSSAKILYAYSCPATVAAQTVKASFGTVSHMVLTNTAASMRFVRLYDALAANVTVASTAANYVIGLQANQTLDVSCGTSGINFSTGITLAVSGAKGLADATAVTAGDVMISLAYV